MFNVDFENGAITMHQGDTGSYKVKATRESGAPWTANDRMILTIGGRENPVIQRFYRLDNDDTLGNGVVLIEFHNDDTDKVPTGNYSLERRYVVNPIWELEEGVEIPTERVCNALTAGAQIVDGHIVRITNKSQTSMMIQPIYGEV